MLVWRGDLSDNLALSEGRVFLTQSEAQATLAESVRSALARGIEDRGEGL